MLTAFVFLTRFNLPTAGVESLVRAEDGWLAERVELFERFTVPSVRAQTTKVRWLVYLDAESPTWLVDRLGPWCAEGLFTPVYRESVSPEELRVDLRSIAGDADRLVTSNLDNDDGVSCDFAARVLALDPGGEQPVAVYLTTGLIHATGGVYRRHDPCNAFVAVAEPASRPVTCWAGWHNLLGRQMPTVTAAGAPAWLQVVHRRNVSNRVRGRLVRADAYRQLFPGLIDDAPSASDFAMARDLLWLGPARTAREIVRAMAKMVAFRMLGAQRFDQLKARVHRTVRHITRARWPARRGARGATRP